MTNNDPGVIRRLQDSNSTASTTAEAVAVVVECMRLSGLSANELITVVALSKSKDSTAGRRGAAGSGFAGWLIEWMTIRNSWLKRSVHGPTFVRAVVEVCTNGEQGNE